MGPAFLQHLVTGINRMIPFIVVGALFTGMTGQMDPASPVSQVLTQLGPDAALFLMLPILAGFIAHSLGGWDALLPGMVGGLLAVRSGSGMLGAILAGYMAGYLADWLNRSVRLPALVADLKPIVVLPILSTVLVGGAMLFAINPPLAALMAVTKSGLMGLQGGSSLLLGLIIGAMAAFDLGGPVNKIASLFAIDLLASGIHQPLGAVVAGVLVPPMSLFLAMQLSPGRFTPTERTQGKTAFLLGIGNIVEPSIPLALADPGRVIPAVTVGGAVAGGLSMLLNVGVKLPIGGFITMAIPGMVTNVGGYLLAIAAGTAVSCLILLATKPVRAVKPDSPAM